MNEEYKKMMRQSLKMSGMSDEQIEAAIDKQMEAMQQYAEAAFGQDLQTMQNEFAGNILDDFFNGGSCFEFSEKPSINKSYQWAVACGADLIHLRADIINDLTTGNDAETCREIFAEQWGIESKADFIKMADSLKAGRHSVIYKRLANGENIADYEEEKEKLQDALSVFKNEGLLSEVPNMLIWDLGRLINITRFAFDAKYIDRTTALAYLKETALLVKENYKSWRELSLGYQFGRAVWGGLEEFETLKESMEQLLTEEDSPWVTLPFDMALDFEA
jgi:hypothetical protein